MLDDADSKEGGELTMISPVAPLHIEELSLGRTLGRGGSATVQECRPFDWIRRLRKRMRPTYDPRVMPCWDRLMPHFLTTAAAEEDRSQFCPQEADCEIRG